MHGMDRDLVRLLGLYVEHDAIEGMLGLARRLVRREDVRLRWVAGGDGRRSGRVGHAVALALLRAAPGVALRLALGLHGRAPRSALGPRALGSGRLVPRVHRLIAAAIVGACRGCSWRAHARAWHRRGCAGEEGEEQRRAGADAAVVDCRAVMLQQLALVAFVVEEAQYLIVRRPPSLTLQLLLDHPDWRVVPDLQLDLRARRSVDGKLDQGLGHREPARVSPVTTPPVCWFYLTLTDDSIANQPLAGGTVLQLAAFCSWQHARHVLWVRSSTEVST